MREQNVCLYRTVQTYILRMYLRHLVSCSGSNSNILLSRWQRKKLETFIEEQFYITYQERICMLGRPSEMNAANLSLSPLQMDSCASEKASIVKKIIGK
jgi:hypothetical protein